MQGDVLAPVPINRFCVSVIKTYPGRASVPPPPLPTPPRRLRQRAWLALAGRRWAASGLPPLRRGGAQFVWIGCWWLPPPRSSMGARAAGTGRPIDGSLWCGWDGMGLISGDLHAWGQRMAACVDVLAGDRPKATALQRRCSAAQPRILQLKLMPASKCNPNPIPITHASI